jgi:hypothetical protein
MGTKASRAPSNIRTCENFAFTDQIHFYQLYPIGNAADLKDPLTRILLGDGNEKGEPCDPPLEENSYPEISSGR